MKPFWSSSTRLIGAALTAVVLMTGLLPSPAGAIPDTPGTPIPVGSLPYGLAVTPDGATAYVANSGGSSVTPITVATNTAGTPITVGDNPYQVAVTPDGATAYVTNLSDDSVTPITVATNTAGTPITVGDGPVPIAITPDGATAYVGNNIDDSVTPITVATNTAGTPISVGDNPFGIAITPDGATAYVTNTDDNNVTPITVANNTAGTPITVGSGPVGIAVTPDGATAYVANLFDNTVTPINVATNTAGTPIPVSGGAWWVAITPDGAAAYVTSIFNSTVTPITVANNTAGTPIPVGSGPYGIATTPDGAAVYVTSQGTNTVTPLTESATGCSTTVSDESELRAALLCADTSATATTVTLGADITLDAGTDPSYSGTAPLVIDGAGHVLDATMSSRVLNSTSAATVTLRDITITGGTAAGDGGGVRTSGPLTLQDATVWRNTAGEDGGGVHTDGDLSVTNSTVSQNSADGEGGGVSSGSTMSVDHATIAANSAEFGANVSGGVFGSLSRSVIADPVDGSNCTLSGVTTSDGDNFSDDTSCALTGDGDDQDPTNDALLGQARNNGPAPTPPEAGAIGSPRPTMYPLNGSPLIDAIESGDCADSPAADQRGVTRPFGADCDIGAIEAVFPAHSFSDATPFFEATIRWVTSTVNTPQILNGFPNGTFGQELNITRGQAARLYYRGAGQPDPLAFAPHGFSDVTPFYEDAVRWAKGVGLFNGYPDNTFRQGDPITRGQYIRSLYNFAGAQDPTQVGPHGLTDVTPFYEDAVRWAKGRGLANGFPDDTFRQDDDIKRGNAARTFYNTAQTPQAWDDPMTAPDNMLFRPNLAP